MNKLDLSLQDIVMEERKAPRKKHSKPTKKRKAPTTGLRPMDIDTPARESAKRNHKRVRQGTKSDLNAMQNRIGPQKFKVRMHVRVHH